MSVAINNNFAPLMINDFMTLLKNKAIDLKDRAIFTPLYKIMEIARDDIYNLHKQLENDMDHITIEAIQEVDLFKSFELMDESKDKLTELYEMFENSTNVYEIQLANIIDETLDYTFKVMAILDLLSVKLKKHNLQAS